MNEPATISRWRSPGYCKKNQAPGWEKAPPTLVGKLKAAAHGLVCEYGCGYGRIAEHFVLRGDGYIGVDINEDAIASCKKRFPNGNFSTVTSTGAGVPMANTYMFVTVLVHVPDTHLGKIIAATTTADRIIIAEVFDPSYRGKGSGQNHHRLASDYSCLFGREIDSLTEIKIGVKPGTLGLLVLGKHKRK